VYCIATAARFTQPRARLTLTLLLLLLLTAPVRHRSAGG